MMHSYQARDRQLLMINAEHVLIRNTLQKRGKKIFTEANSLPAV